MFFNYLSKTATNQPLFFEFDVGCVYFTVFCLFHNLSEKHSRDPPSNVGMFTDGNPRPVDFVSVMLHFVLRSLFK